MEAVLDTLIKWSAYSWWWYFPRCGERIWPTRVDWQVRPSSYRIDNLHSTETRIQAVHVNIDLISMQRHLHKRWDIHRHGYLRYRLWVPPVVVHRWSVEEIFDSRAWRRWGRDCTRTSMWADDRAFSAERASLPKDSDGGDDGTWTCMGKKQDGSVLLRWEDAYSDENGNSPERGCSIVWNRTQSMFEDDGGYWNLHWMELDGNSNDAAAAAEGCSGLNSILWKFSFPRPLWYPVASTCW